jgi:nucleoside-diphosphate-sugar epimerase
MGTWDGGREKAPAAMCRKVAEAEEGGQVEVWGPGDQTRSFLYIDDCIQASIDLMATEDEYYFGPTNIGSEEMVSINQLAQMAIDISGKDLTVWNNLENTALGVRGRVSENSQLQSSIGWKPTRPLKVGMTNTYEWIEEQVAKGEEG